MSSLIESKLIALISVNPKAGRRSSRILVDRLVEALRRRDFEVETYDNLAAVATRANELFSARRLQALIGVGGDGTAAELVNRTLPGVPITLLPTGTANLIARYLKLPKSPEECAEMIADGAVLTLDVGVANDRLFLIMASAGIDAQIVREVDSKRKERFELRPNDQGGHIGYRSYVLPLVKSAKTYRFPQIKLETLSETGTVANSTILGRWSLVFNLPQYGWGLPLSPGCSGFDGQLNHCVFKGKLVSEIIGAIFAQFWSLHRILPNVNLGRAVAYRLSPTESDAIIPYQLDGDPCGFLPIEIRTIPKRFTVMTPKTTVRKLKS